MTTNHRPCNAVCNFSLFSYIPRKLRLSRIVTVFLLWLVISAPGFGQEENDEKGSNADSSAARRRLEFLQNNFSKFIPVRFAKGANSEAAIQYVKFANKFETEGKRYFGFRFTVPEWIDGDLSWFFLLAKNETQKDFHAKGLLWYIIPEKGDSRGFQSFRNHHLAAYKDLKFKFPYTETLVSQRLSRDRLEPGKTYAIWFQVEEEDFPTLAFAMTIDSARGQQEFGRLPLH